MPVTKTRRTYNLYLSPDDENPCAIYQFDLDEADDRIDSTLLLDTDVFNEMGAPETITVTVEPGDRLND